MRSASELIRFESPKNLSNKNDDWGFNSDPPIVGQHAANPYDQCKTCITHDTGYATLQVSSSISTWLLYQSGRRAVSLRSSWLSFQRPSAPLARTISTAMCTSGKDVTHFDRSRFYSRRQLRNIFILAIYCLIMTHISVVSFYWVLCSALQYGNYSNHGQRRVDCSLQSRQRR